MVWFAQFLSMDMDGLKQINDTYGHRIGAGTIAEVVTNFGPYAGFERPLTRFGENEFSAFLASCLRAEGLYEAEDISDP